MTVHDRRRVVTVSGLLVIVMATGTACIFEKSSYQGGGRQDQGASGTTATASTSASAVPTEPTATSTSTADAATYLDAAVTD